MHTYTYDTHVHTAETSACATIAAKELVHVYNRFAYRGLVITDHYHGDFFRPRKGLSWQEKMDVWLSGYRSARDEGRKIGMDILLGMEIRFDESPNDYLVYGLDEDFLYTHEALHQRGIQAFKQLAKDNGLLVYQAHPFRKGASPAKPAYIDGIEVYNGNRGHDSRNHLAYAYALEHGLKMSSGSDFHHGDDLATGGMVLDQAPKHSRDFVHYLETTPVSTLLLLGRD